MTSRGGWVRASRKPRRSRPESDVQWAVAIPGWPAADTGKMTLGSGYVAPFALVGAAYKAFTPAKISAKPCWRRYPESDEAPARRGRAGGKSIL